ncbi:MAG TPA: coproporphyrinogen III oxidase family protein [Deltaproteobacteria bacterium]|nr:coproporphyrinogen III oxidase family protein [Deltaproteobacteria bacterium]
MIKNIISRIVARKAQQEFSRALRFEDGAPPELPSCCDEKPRLLYLHIPFCEELCPYCSFHRVIFDESSAKKYFAALRREIGLYREKGYKFSGIYVGGGTPTVMIDELAETLNLARDIFSIKEISVETNPDHLTAKNIETLQRCHVNRLSVGVQTFNDELLKKMGRLEKYGSGEVIAEKLKDTQGALGTLNADMIFNLPAQTSEELNADLDVLLDLKVDQITFYPLMVSSITRELMSQTMGVVDFKNEYNLYKIITRRLETDYNYSSAWCFSRREAPIDEYVVDYDEYAGLGSGAIGYMNGVCYANTFDIKKYMKLLEDEKLPLMAARRFDLPDRMRYDFMMKFFSTKLDLATLEEKYEGRFAKTLWKEMGAFQFARAFRYFSPYLSLTPWGRYLWVIMMREFFIAVNNFRDYCRKEAGIE